MSISGDSNYSLNLQHTVSLLKPAVSYRFRYRGINAFGLGDFSDETVVISATVPDKIAKATTVVVGTNVKISWLKPRSRGSTIEYYAVYIETSSGAMSLYGDNCVGTSSNVLYDQNCNVP